MHVLLMTFSEDDQAQAALAPLGTARIGPISAIPGVGFNLVRRIPAPFPGAMGESTKPPPSRPPMGPGSHPREMRQRRFDARIGRGAAAPVTQV